MNISENKLESNILTNISGCADDAALMLGFDTSQKSPKKIIEIINAFLLKWQKGERPSIEDDDDLSFIIGSLWGEQLIKEFGWHWAGITFHDHNNTKAVGVISPDASFAVYPFHFVYGCMANNAPVTILLAYNLLKDESRVPPVPTGGYQNVMDYVHHIVPHS